MELQLQKLTQKYEQPPFISCASGIEVKQREQDNLDRQKEIYFKNGGTVTVGKPTSVIISPEELPLTNPRDKRLSK